MNPRHYTQRGKPTSRPLALYDKWLMSAVVMLLLIGIMMVASSSVTISTKYFQQPFHFLMRQVAYLSLGIFVAFFIARIEMTTWERKSTLLLLLTLILLGLVLIPGIGKTVNGSRRWISLGLLSVQVSELVKPVVILYMAAYLVRQQKAIANTLSAFIKPMLVLGFVCVLLLAEPDFGATVVLTGTVMMMLFLAGVRFRYYLVLLLLVAAAFTVLAVTSPYRLARLTAFLNPWADQFNTGYQLTQSLIAFGRGGTFGVGLGEGVQKLFYLPEAHTDFLFAVLAEESGLMGAFLVLILYCIVVVRGLMIGFSAFVQQMLFSAFVAYGLSFSIALQAVINISVNTGLLPTKGLTLPFLSYGGASLIVNCMVVALLLRIDHETRWRVLGLK